MFAYIMRTRRPLPTHQDVSHLLFASTCETQLKRDSSRWTGQADVCFVHVERDWAWGATVSIKACLPPPPSPPPCLPQYSAWHAARSQRPLPWLGCQGLGNGRRHGPGGREGCRLVYLQTRILWKQDLLVLFIEVSRAPKGPCAAWGHVHCDEDFYKVYKVFITKCSILKYSSHY